ncbi:isoleucyl-tRNA synthetase [Aster yellows witches'-broom phytoplasma AYWB]|uniref:Isoleucine--tRNA ligase n=2 Tax=16SrI (Aster yellows group) TaxID=3042590 RepID=Q2NIU1_AYWBP|nr:MULTISPECIES: isoleucine--tRNA ligase [16SrI (Aster yellows group)]ABC65652.1 isoleucyl-tRNA synthetase [Aster yellows witches'-broom phytoplasma AYWB]PEH36154.1 isoleucine--tRNA ligase [New Jersey aster yellows phytoplasma]
MTINYKTTLLMPKTDFPMKGNLGKNEINIQKNWQTLDLYQKKLQQNQDNASFILHDGPPYANGNIHMGHALNKILKDFIIRFRSMQGFYTPFIPGWDTHGLPIEAAVLKKTSKKAFTRKSFLDKCQEFALENVNNQKKQFQRLGILGDWQNPYLTLDKTFVADQVRIFGKMVAKGLIFKALKPIHWSPTLESALAEAELEYHNHQSPSVYVAFNMKKLDIFDNVALVIWTTTPWTLPANVAIAVHPEKEYQLIEVLQKRYLVGTKNIPFLQKVFVWNPENIKFISTFEGKTLEHLTYHNHLASKPGKIILSQHVLDEEGTGLVHIAPGHGLDDFLVGQKYNLDVVCSIDKKGMMTDVSQYQGLFYTKANEAIISDLEKNHSLLKADVISHSYPHDWRTKKPVISLALPQWFVSIKKIKSLLLEEAQKVKWIPRWGGLKMTNMITNREDWNISRQRTWGIPIPIFYTETQQPILDLKLINHVADLFEQHGMYIWYEWDVKKLLPENYTHPQSPKNLFTKELDIMDVWFDSGTSYSVLKKRNQVLQSDVYFEGSDQYRGWFNSSLIISVATQNQAPYKTVITHGFVFDGEGKKMSKSLGNVIDPLTVAEQKGADIIRLWVANINYNLDVRINSSILKQVEDLYRKIRNTFRFMLGNLDNFKKDTNYIAFEQRTFIHQAMMLDFEEVLKNVLHSYDTYNFEGVLRHLFPFITNKISAFYLDFAKDILYIEKEDYKERKMIQSTIYDLLLSLLQVLTPIIPHTTSEVYGFFPFAAEKDIYLEKMPQPKTRPTSHLLLEYHKFLILRKNVLQHLEKARQSGLINSSLQAHITLSLTQEEMHALDVLQIKDQLHQLFIVSKVTLQLKDTFDVKVAKASGYACKRCWNVVINNPLNPLCTRCQNILKQKK